MTKHCDRTPKSLRVPQVHTGFSRAVPLRDSVIVTKHGHGNKENGASSDQLVERVTSCVYTDVMAVLSLSLPRGISLSRSSRSLSIQSSLPTPRQRSPSNCYLNTRAHELRSLYTYMHTVGRGTRHVSGP